MSLLILSPGSESYSRFHYAPVWSWSVDDYLDHQTIQVPAALNMTLPHRVDMIHLSHVGYLEELWGRERRELFSNTNKTLFSSSKLKREWLAKVQKPVDNPTTDYLQTSQTGYFVETLYGETISSLGLRPFENLSFSNEVSLRNTKNTHKERRK